MADKSKQPIIIKRIQGSHAGGHGGAWKVAFADFMTAMMCFFLVMWLMGADEATRAAVSAYFNNPTSVFRPDVASPEVVPLGDKTGAGESVLKGADGQIPEDMIDRPAKPFQLDQSSDKHPGEMLNKLLEGLGQFKMEQMKFSVPEALIFEPGSDKMREEAPDFLIRVGKLLKVHRGRLEIKGYSSPIPAELAEGSSSYDFAVTRVVAIQRYFVTQKWIEEDRMEAGVSDDRKPAGFEGGKLEREIDFLFIRQTQR
jgi:flagellar motor protein MotB